MIGPRPYYRHLLGRGFRVETSQPRLKDRMDGGHDTPPSEAGNRRFGRLITAKSSHNMVVDEFGREIPAPSGGGASGGPPMNDYPRRPPEPSHYGPSSRSSGGPPHRPPPPPPPPPESRLSKHPSKLYQEEPILCEFVWKDRQSSEQETYEEYRRDYCLRYVRSFFNKHLDDSWFRARYSPAVRRARALQERLRAKQEALAMASALQTNREALVEGARLGSGTKVQARASLPIPSSHLHSMMDRALLVEDIPTHVTDRQLTQALLDHCQASSAQVAADDEIPLLQLFLTQPVTRPFKQEEYLSRQAIVVAKSPAMIAELLLHLQSTSRAAPPPPRNSLVVPRKGEEEEEVVVCSLDIECSDPYGRMEYDADGKGGAPADGLAIPERKATVRVQRYQAPSHPCAVLSAALSSKSRIARDKKAAILMARALDVNKQIPTECRLDELLESLTDQPEEDVLDVAIAYLRRVHLFSFYNGCSMADGLAEVWTGKHASSTIHLRLQNADDLLAETAPPPAMEMAEEPKTEKGGDDKDKANEQDDSAAHEPPPPPPKDLLVQRLDDSIAKALEDCNDWINAGGDLVVDAETDAAALAIVEAEQALVDTWMQNHALLDDDQRARCSFHFCHKLFKDSSFLYKHLLKKHGEFLLAEQAKCHDEAMMQAWDAEEHRPVPEILMDCGANFGLVAVAVFGREPDCVDPEPGLWQKEEERRQREADQRQRRDELRQQARKESAQAFVDVDDMKEEKVELSFENVAVPVLNKKKKKKRKLL